MQNKYTADIGDFGKYGLLRALCKEQPGATPPKLGIVWHLVEDEPHNNDGRHTSYLRPTAKNKKAFHACDPDLYAAMQEIMASDCRSVAKVQQADLMPAETVFYQDTVPVPSRTRDRVAKLETRDLWAQRALAATEDCSVVFVDPDNGIKKRQGPYTKKDVKHVFLDELSPYVARGQSLIVYHHLNRSKPAQAQVAQKQTEILLETGHRAFTLLYHRGSARAFFIIPNNHDRPAMVNQAWAFLETPWANHFTIKL